jgi:hypothetical protein
MMIPFEKLRLPISIAGSSVDLWEKAIKNEAGETVAKIAAGIERDGSENTATIELEGTFLRACAEEMEIFLDTVGGWQVERWILRFDELKYLHEQAWTVLIGFARTIRRRGGRMEIDGIQTPAAPVLQAARLAHLLRHRSHAKD